MVQAASLGQQAGTDEDHHQGHLEYGQQVLNAAAHPQTVNMQQR